MDRSLTSPLPFPGREDALRPEEPGMPAEAPARMPAQSLSEFDRSSRRAAARPEGVRSSAWRRAFVFGATFLLAGLAINEMRQVLAVGGLTVLEILVLVLFALNVTWISMAFVTSVAGLFRLIGRRAHAPPVRKPLSTRTALLMPTYNEDPARVAAALEAMARGIAGLGEGRSFDLFVLSDTTDPDVAMKEHAAVHELRRRVGGDLRVHYRRRARNTAHKSGNVREFCQRWGGAYDHLLMLDADSLMEGATLVELARRMEADPDAGLIQTTPRLLNGTTLVARVQQFAGRVYGPLLGAGLAWWTGKEGNFWGHNAILRTCAFTGAAGLPELPGRPPRGGPILSHDFVEAALLRRAGWSVIVADDLDGSYEECPSTLVDLAVRDRRWCQGNLQHLRVLGTKGLHWVSRLHLLTGILSYLSSPLWLLFLVAALALGVQDLFARPEYFTREYSLFPFWPRQDPVRAVRLFFVTLGILLGPKVLGTVSFAASPRRLWRSGGPLLLLGLLLETLVSALLAPLLMLIHCGIVADVLRGRDTGWRPQRRADESLPWSQVLRRHRWHVVVGILLALTGWSISRQMLAWLSPALVGMVLAVPLSLLTGSAGAGRTVKRLGLLRTPEEAREPAVQIAADAAYPFYRDAVERAPDLLAVAGGRDLLDRHLALIGPEVERPRGRVDPVEAVAERKIREARDREEAVAFLTPPERARVQSIPSLLLLLAGLPGRRYPALVPPSVNDSRP
jgi:membrane glycosyltransferase